MDHLQLHLRMPNHDIIITEHAAARYAERVRSSLPRETSDQQLAQVLPFATLERSVDWVAGQHNPYAYLMLGSDIAFPLMLKQNGELAATTCLTYGGLGEVGRTSRNISKRRRRLGEISDDETDRRAPSPYRREKSRRGAAAAA